MKFKKPITHYQILTCFRNQILKMTIFPIYLKFNLMLLLRNQYIQQNISTDPNQNKKDLVLDNLQVKLHQDQRKLCKEKEILKPKEVKEVILRKTNMILQMRKRQLKRNQREEDTEIKKIKLRLRKILWKKKNENQLILKKSSI